jgi:FkbM family methyltransferase
MLFQKDMLKDFTVFTKRLLKYGKLSGIIMITRKNTYDSEIVKEVQHGEYKKLLVNSDDVILDLGAHIGSFTCMVSSKVKKVVSYEADPNNFELLKENTKDLKNVEIHNQAVFDKNQKELTFYRAKRRQKEPRQLTLFSNEKLPKRRRSSSHLNTGMTSLYETRGREKFFVEAISFQEILDRVKPTKIKCDIEGAEYIIFKEPLMIPNSVKEIIFEVHLKPDSLKQKYFGFESYLNSQGIFEVDKEKRSDFLKLKTWNRTLLFRRKQ